LSKFRGFSNNAPAVPTAAFFRKFLLDWSMFYDFMGLNEFIIEPDN
jgi:hypothetical protein